MKILKTMLNKNLYSQKGVSITELAISISIIAILIASTFGGISILKAAKIRKLATEFTNYKTAVDEFNKQYSHLPGDLPTASSYWSGAHNGNGDGYVDDATTEDLYAWEHLANAGLIAGTYSGAVVDGSNKYGISTNAINSEAVITGIFSFYGTQTRVYATGGHALRLGSLATGAIPTNGTVVAKDAYSIDTKLDDGLASSGMFYTTRVSSGCTDADSTANSANYVLSDLTNTTCYLWYWYKKF